MRLTTGLLKSLQKVLATKKPDTASVLRYPIHNPQDVTSEERVKRQSEKSKPFSALSGTVRKIRLVALSVASTTTVLE